MSLVYVEVNHVVCRLITHQVTRVVSANHLQHVPSTAGRLRRTGTSVPSRQLVSSLVIGGDCDSFTFLFVHTRACVFTPIDRSQAIRLSVLLNSLRSTPTFHNVQPTSSPDCPGYVHIPDQCQLHRRRILRRSILSLSPRSLTDNPSIRRQAHCPSYPR